MTDKTVKVGDVVAWDEVPSGAMVKLHEWFAYRRLSVGRWIGSPFSKDFVVDKVGWQWGDGADTPTIIALNLTGHELADELRVLAEAFEREHPAT